MNLVIKPGTKVHDLITVPFFPRLENEGIRPRAYVVADGVPVPAYRRADAAGSQNRDLHRQL